MSQLPYTMPGSPFQYNLPQMPAASAHTAPAGGGMANSLMSNPWFHLGAGILGANRPGASFGQAVGQGLLGGMNSYQSQVRQNELIQRERALQQLREQQLAMKVAQAKRKEKEEKELRAWMTSKGMDPRTPMEFAKMQWKSQFPGAATFGTSVHLVYDKTTGQTLPAQASTGGALRLANGEKFDPAKHEYRKPVQFIDRGGSIVPGQPVTGQVQGGGLQPVPHVVPPSEVPSPFIDQTTGQQVQLPPGALGPGETLSPQSKYVPAGGGAGIQKTLPPEKRPEYLEQAQRVKTTAAEETKNRIESMKELREFESRLPRLMSLVTELSALGQKATYTRAGQFVDAAKRQLGMDVGEGAVARKEYISKVDNETLPLLRQTFGAQFTQAEGESLKKTLGDPDASPEEKDAVLRSFIKGKMEELNTKYRKMGLAPKFPEFALPETAAPGKMKFLGFE